MTCINRRWWHRATRKHAGIAHGTASLAWCRPRFGWGSYQVAFRPDDEAGWFFVPAWLLKASGEADDMCGVMATIGNVYEAIASGAVHPSEIA